MLFGGSRLKTRKFEYNPRYYDPKKEERELRKRSRELEKDQSIEGAKHRISQSFQSSRERKSIRSSASSRSNKMILGIVFLLVVLFYLFAKDFLPSLLEKLAI